MNRFLTRYLILFAALGFTSCGEEAYVYPDLITEMVCLKTDNQGFSTHFITDEGHTWHLAKDNRPDSLTADSTYRVVSRYAPLSETDAKAYSFTKPFPHFPN